MVGSVFGSEKAIIIVLVSASCILGYITAQMSVIKIRLLHILMLTISLFLMLLLQLSMQRGIQQRLDQDCAKYTGACLLRAKLAVAESDAITLRKIIDYLTEQELQDQILLRMQVILALWEKNHQPIKAWIDQYPNDAEMIRFYIRFLEERSQFDLAMHYNQLLLE